MLHVEEEVREQEEHERRAHLETRLGQRRGQRERVLGIGDRAARVPVLLLLLLLLLWPEGVHFGDVVGGRRATRGRRMRATEAALDEQLVRSGCLVRWKHDALEERLLLNGQRRRARVRRRRVLGHLLRHGRRLEQEEALEERR